MRLELYCFVRHVSDGVHGNRAAKCSVTLNCILHCKRKSETHKHLKTVFVFSYKLQKLGSNTASNKMCISYDPIGFIAEIKYLFFNNSIVANKKYLAHIWLECFVLIEALNFPCLHF